MNGVNVEVALSKQIILGGMKKRTVYVVLSVMPDGSAVVVGSRELVFDLDVSPSMNGRCKSGRSAIDETKSAAIEAIHLMPDTDFVSVYTFSTFDDQPVATTSLSLMRANAVQEVNMLQTNGGTRLGPALKRAVKKKGKNIRRVILLTDGDSNNPSTDLIECQDAVSSADACPVWAFAIGPDYNEAQLKAIVASAKAGSFLRHVSDASEILQEFREQIAVLQGTGGVSDVVITFVTDPGFRILSAARLVPDQQDVTVTDADTKVSFAHGDLDSVYGQQLVLEVEVSADTLGFGQFMIGNFLVSFNTPVGSQKEYGEVWIQITDDEALSGSINDQVMNTALTVRGTRLATMGKVDQAQTLLTAAGHAGLAKRLSTIGSTGDSNDSRALRTTLGTISKKTISSSGGN
jgi:hypothetical protein